MSSLKDALARELPLLRRYARAMTGSQAVGDACVRALLEAMMAEPQFLDDTRPPRLALYRLFHAVWGDTIGRARATGKPGTPEERLAALAPVHRQALLLTVVEGFSFAETAEILGLDPVQVPNLVEEAQAELERQMETTVLIIEDESIIALELAAIVRDLGHTVVGVADRRSDAVALARRMRPGLVLADIQLADGSSGIDAVRDIQSEQDIPAVFVTAFPERLLTGTAPEPTYLVTKPFQPESVHVAIGQALFFQNRQQQEAAS